MTEKPLFKDKRGEIISIAEHADVIRITSVKGSRRANHYHREFGHWCLVTRGNIIYAERPVGSLERPEWKSYGLGECFWTGPMVEHVMLFPDFDENEFYCFSVGARDRDSYEKDTYRLMFDLDLA